MSASDSSLSAERLCDLLTALSEALGERGQRAFLFVVGGAAMALAYDGQRATRDIDAVFQPAPLVRELAARIGRETGLEDDWLNDAAKGFLPGDDASPRTVLDTEHLLVQVASPEYLLAMKIHSGRDERDINDAVRLYNIVGYTGADQLIDLLERTYPPRLLLPRHQYIAYDVAERAAAAAQHAGVERTRDIHRMAMPARPTSAASPSSEAPAPQSPPRSHDQHHRPGRAL